MSRMRGTGSRDRAPQRWVNRIYCARLYPDPDWGVMSGVYRADMLISEVLTSNQAAAEVFARHGLSCASCLAADMETLAAVAQMHDVDVDVLIGELDSLSGTPSEEVR